MREVFMAWVNRLTALFKRNRTERDLDEELQHHIELKTQENIEAGMSPDEARYAALRAFGGVEQKKEQCRDADRLRWFEDLIQDLRYGLRQLRRNPGFTAVAVLTLALGIGANTTIFSFINALLLRPPSGIKESNRLVSVWNRMPDGHSIQFSYPEYLYFRDHNDVFAGLLAYSSDPDSVSWTQSGQSRLIMARMVTANYFSLLGVKPVLGRGFLPGEDKQPGSQPVTILSHAFWERDFSGDPRVIGKTIVLNGHSFTVVGIAPGSFSDLETAIHADCWTPITMQKEIVPGEDLLRQRMGYWIFVAGRLKAGITRAQAQANMSVLAHQLALAHPHSNKGWDATADPLTGIDPEFRGYVVAFASLLMVVAGLVLLIACANAANLLLAQASGRWREMAIRAAVGARRNRIIRQVLTEGVLISALAGGLGILLAMWTAPLVLALKPPMLSFIQLNLPLDWRMIAFTAIVSVVTGVLFGVAPALNSSKIDVVSRLKDETHSSYRLSRFRSALVVVQVAVCLVLIVAATLCLRSLLSAQSIDPGFAVKNRLVVTMDLSMLGYSNEQAHTFYSQAVERVDALPSVRSATVANPLPLGFSQMGVTVVIPSDQSPAGQKGYPAVGLSYVGPHYFGAMSIPVLEGREFSPQDNDKAPGVVIINEAMARRYWPRENPVGRRISFSVRKWPSAQIVGVVKTGKYHSLGEAPQPFVYRPFLQMPDARQATLVVETAVPPGGLIPTIRRTIQAIDPAVPITDSETMQQYMSAALFPAHFTGVLVGVFGGLALALATVGLYGVIAYSVAQRTREMGIRVALGATRADVMRLVIGQGIRLAFIGVVAGVVVALAVTRLISSLLYGVSATDPIAFVAASALLLLVALAACYIPARRSMKLDPIVALRFE
jgi:putative ABC transport system permease protein